MGGFHFTLAFLTSLCVQKLYEYEYGYAYDLLTLSCFSL